MRAFALALFAASSLSACASAREPWVELAGQRYAIEVADDDPSYPSQAPARYVLELNAGEAARLQLQDGAELTFGPGIPLAK